MILVQLLGGLGNQMFQYAAGRALAARHATKLLLDVTALQVSESSNTPRHYALGPFTINASIATTTMLRAFAVRRHLHLAKRIQERGHNYNPDFAQAGPYAALFGYWQSELYFNAIEPVIRREFTVRTPPSPRDAALLEEIGAVNAVSVHIRRGDYVSSAATNAFHGLLPLDYYARAADLITEQVTKPHFYAFSDEPDWVREHIRLNGPMTIIDHHGPDEAHEDLRLMSACQYHIIANSSFSWWGAWLSVCPGKVVIAPRQWFRATDIDTSDVCPPEWIRL